jgi:hypothetical protein
MNEQKSAMIVEIRGAYAAALRDDGVFVRVHNAGYDIGQTIMLDVFVEEESISPTRVKRRRSRVTAFAGVAAGFLLLLLGGFKGYTTPVGVVSLDVNPSIEYSINCFDRVLDISAVNEDAEKILAGLDEDALRYRPVDEAVDATIAVLRENGYLTDVTENDVVISAASYSERHTDEITQRLGQRVRQQADLTVYSIPVSENDVQSAHNLGTSAGKLQIIERLGDSWGKDETFDPGDWVARPVREIIRETKEQADANQSEKGNPKSTTAGEADVISGGAKTPQQSQQQSQQQAGTTQDQPSGGTSTEQDPAHTGEPKLGGKTP